MSKWHKLEEHERDGPFDLTASEVIAKMEAIGVAVNREQASAFIGWAHTEMRRWIIEQDFFPEEEELPSIAFHKWLNKGPKLAAAAGCYVGIKVSQDPTSEKS